MKVADYIAQRLAAEGITHVFLVQGAANNSLIYSLADAKGIDYVCCVHEQACGFAAEGYAKVKGIPGCAVTTSGPGGQNLITPIANCYYDSVPVLFITGQVNSFFMRPEGAALRQLGFQEWPVVDCIRPITKYAACVRRAEHVPYELEKALHLCQEGRPGPVLLDFPIDVQKAEVNVTQFDQQCPFLQPYKADLAQVRYAAEQFLDDFWQAKRPALLIGGGVRTAKAIAAFDRVAAALQVPVFPTWNALDVVTSDFPWYGGRVGTYGGAGRNFGIQNCDLLLAVGCRLSGRITGGEPSTFARAARRYAVDVDAGLLDPHFQPQPFHVNVLCDAERFFEQLLFAFYARGSYVYGGNDAPPPNHALWMERVQEWCQRYDPVRPEFFEEKPGWVHPYAFVRNLSHQAPPNAVIVNDCGGNAVVSNQAFETKHGQRYFSNNGNSPMGFAMCGALGAWFADPSRPVLCIIGDGGFCMNIQELQTLVNYGVGIKVFVLDNRCYGITKAFQAAQYGDRFEACGPVGYNPPCFEDVVQRFGCEGKRIAVFRTSDDVPPDLTIQKMLEHKGPAVCIVHCPEFYTYEPRISGLRIPIERMTPALPEEEFLANMIIPPLERL